MISSSQQSVESEQKKKKQKYNLFVIKRKAKNGMWQPIALYDNEGHYRGLAVFEDWFKALKYMQKYEEMLLAKNYLNSRNSLDKTELKLFIEKEYPQMQRSYLSY